MRDLVTEYLNYLRVEKGLSGNTIAAYNSDLRVLQNLLRDREGKTLTEATRADVQAWLHGLRKQGCAPRSVARALTAARGFYKYLLLDEHLSADPTANISFPHLAQKLPQHLSAEQVDKLIDRAARNTRPNTRQASDNAICDNSLLTSISLSNLPKSNSPKSNLPKSKSLKSALNQDSELKDVLDDSVSIGESVSDVRPPEKGKESLLEQRLQAALEAAVLEFLYATGLRVSELINLRESDVDKDTGVVLCLGKGGKQRRVPVGKAALERIGLYQALQMRHRREEDARSEHINRRDASKRTPAANRVLKKTLDKKVSAKRQPVNAKDGERLFMRGGKPLTRQYVWAMVKAHARALGLEGVSPHTLRHTFATQMLNGGADSRSVQTLLGHASLETTQLYTHLTNERVRETFNRCHPRAGKPVEQSSEAIGQTLETPLSSRRNAPAVPASRAKINPQDETLKQCSNNGSLKTQPPLESDNETYVKLS